MNRGVHVQLVVNLSYYHQQQISIAELITLSDSLGPSSALSDQNCERIRNAVVIFYSNTKSVPSKRMQAA